MIQRVHPVPGGNRVDPETGTAVRDREDGRNIGLFPKDATANDAWKPEAQRTGGNGHGRDERQGSSRAGRLDV